MTAKRSAHRVAVTGAAGKTGLAVTRALTRAGFEVSGLVRRPEQADAVLASGAIDATVVDLADADALAEAIVGRAAVYHVPPNMHPDEPALAAGLVDAMKRAGVPRLVLHSVLAPYLPEMAHHLRKARSEELVRGSGLAWTILQPASYAQNLLGYVDEVRRTGVLQIPYSAAAPFTPVDLHDVADVAALVLADPEAHLHGCYELCGPARLSTEDMAGELAKLLDRPVRVEAQSPEEWRAQSDLPPQPRDDLAGMFGYYDRHGLVGSSWTLTQLLGRTPTRFADAIRRDLAATDVQA